MMNRIATLLIAVLCVFAPATAFAAGDVQAVAIAPTAAQPTFTIVYPHEADMADSAQFTPAAIAEGCVRVVIENTTWLATEGAPWDGVLLDTQVEIDALQDNMRTLVDKALAQEGFPESSGAPSYLKAIDGLGDPESGAGCYGEKAGWMVMLNGWFINEGMNAFEGRLGKVREGDEIRLVYSCDGGPDVGSDSARNIKELASLATDIGVLSPGFSADVADYTLRLPLGTSRVYMKPTPKNQNFQARMYLGDADPYEAGYRFNDAMPVQNGSIITVMVGYVDTIDSLSWPSMNNSMVPAKTYRIAVAVEQAPVDLEEPGQSSGPAADNAAARESAATMAITLNTAKVTGSAIAKACRKAGKKPAALNTVILGPKVKKLSKAAFKAFPKVKTLVVKTKKLKKSSVKGALKGSKIKTIVVQVGGAKLNKKYVKKYKKLFTKKACGRKALVK